MGPLLTSMAKATVLWPSIAALATLILAARLRAAGALAIGTGFLTGYALIAGNFARLPHEAQDWLPYLIVVNILLFLYDSGLSYRGRLALQAALSILGAALIFSPLFKTGIPFAQFAFAAALWFLIWASMAGERSIALLPVALGNAVVSATTGSTMLGQLGGVLTAVLALTLVFSLLKTRFQWSHASTAVAVTILASLMLIGRTYADTALVPDLLLLSAFAVDFVARRMVKAPYAPYLGAALASAPVAIAMFMAIRSYQPQTY